MPLIMLKCKKCGKVFSSGINVGPGSSATFINNKSKCPFCGSWENIPDGTFKATVEGFVEVLKSTDSPIQKAKELLEALEKAKTKDDFEKVKSKPKFQIFKKWLPDSPEKIAAYIAIIYTILQLMVKSPGTHIEYDVFIKEYNQTIEINLDNYED